MKNTIVCRLFLIFVFTGIGNVEAEIKHEELNHLAIETKSPLTIGDLYKALGYTDIKRAIDVYERKFNTVVSLPQKMPFKYNLSYGKVNDTELILDFIDDNNHNLFKLTIDQNKSSKIKRNFTLKNGRKVHIQEFGADPYVRSLEFIRNDDRYILEINYLKSTKTQTC